MDAQIQKKLTEIEHRLNYLTEDLEDYYDDDVYFLLQLIHEQQIRLNDQDTYIANVSTMMPQYGLDEYIPDDKEEAYREGYRVALVDVDSVLHGGVMP